MRLKWKSKANIPHHDLRGDYSWIDDFLKVENYYKQIDEKKAELEAVKKAPRSLADVKRTFKASQARLLEQQQESLKAFIISYSRHNDPLSQLRFELPDSLLRVNADFPDDLINEVFTKLKEVWPADAITDAARKKQKESLSSDIENLQAEIAEYPLYQKWSEFVEFWRGLCSKVSEAPDPQGLELAAKIRPGDHEAFFKLGLEKWLNPKSAVLPALAN
jgi:hypothetical protein